MVNLDNYRRIIEEIGVHNTRLIAVSKFKTKEDILTLYREGHRDFGENYVQELLEKAESLPKDIRWHFIGHLQSNKVKLLIPNVNTIHSVDRYKILDEINKQAKIFNVIIPVLLQVYVGNESTKYGLDEKELLELLERYECNRGELEFVKIIGLMGMASLTEEKEKITSEFKKISDLFHIVKTQFFLGDKDFCELSMGMSSDYNLAIENGSTMVRIGSTIFGNR